MTNWLGVRKKREKHKPKYYWSKNITSDSLPILYKSVKLLLVIVSPDRTWQLFLSKRDFHRICRRYFEALKRVFCGASLNFALKFNERNIVSAGYQAHLFEAGEPVTHSSRPAVSTYKQENRLQVQQNDKGSFQLALCLWFYREHRSTHS